MADEDFNKINGQVAQGFVPGGSKAAATSHSLANISFFYAATDCIFSFNTGSFAAAVNLPAFMVIGVPSDATSVTFTEATAICYMRKNQANG